MPNYAQTLAELMLRSGEDQAAGIRQGGAIWGNLANQLGQIPGNVIAQQRADQAAAQEKKLRDAQIADYQAQAGQRAAAAAQTSALNDAYTHGTDKASAVAWARAHGQGAIIPDIEAHYDAADKSAAELANTKLELQNKQADYVGQLASSVKANAYSPASYAMAIAHAKTNGLMDDQQAGQYLALGIQSPDKIKGIVDNLIAASPAQQKAAQEAAKPTVLPEGATAINQTGAVIATGAPKPPAAQNEAALALAAQSTDPTVAGPARRALASLQAGQTETARHNRAMEEAANPMLTLTGGQGGTAGTAGQGPGPTGDDFLKQLPATQGNLVKALAEGRLQFPSGFALKSPYWQGLLQAVSQYDPSFDAVNYNGRNKARQDFTAGASAKQITALNTVIGHLGDLSQKADALNGSSIPALNAAKNWLKTATGSSDVTNFDTVKKGVTDELTRVWRQAGGSEQDIKQWASTLNASESPTQLKGAFSTIAGMLGARLDALNNQKQQGLGRFGNDISVITPNSQNTLQKLSDEQATSGGHKVGDVVTLKNGQTVTIKKLNDNGTFDY